MGFIRKFVTVLASLSVLVIGVGLIGMMAMARPKIERQEPVLTPPAVFFTVAQPQSVTLDVFAQGEVRPRTDIQLTSQVSGKIVARASAFVFGGAFEKDQLLLKIEDADYRVAVASARARVAQAEEQLKREQAETTLARRDFEDLSDSGGASGDPSELALRAPQLAQARAQYEAAKADYSGAQLNLARTEIRAPFKGRVRDVAVGEGQFIGPGALLGRIFSTDVAEIRLTLTDNDLAKLGLPFGFVETQGQPGPTVVLTGEIANEAHTWQGRIARTEGAFDAATRQIAAVAVVDDPYGAASDGGAPLAVGLFVDAAIVGKRLEGAFVLPRAALYGQDLVFVIGDDDRLIRRTVRIASAERDTIIVIAGISAGERVATSPLRGADDGDAVTPEIPASAAAQADPEPDLTDDPSATTPGRL